MSDDRNTTAGPSSKVHLSKNQEPPTDHEIIEKIMSSLISVIHTKHEVIRRAMAQKGGWEGWLQVELADKLQNSGQHWILPGITLKNIEVFREYTTEREIKVFEEDPHQKIDLWLEPDRKFRRRWPYIGIELKTYSEGQEESNSTLSERFMDDVHKCTSGIKPRVLPSGENKVLLLCVGVTPNKKDLKPRKSRKEPDHADYVSSFEKVESKNVLKKVRNDRGLYAKPLYVLWTWMSQTIDGEGGEDEDVMSDTGNSDDDDDGGPVTDKAENEEGPDDPMTDSGGSNHKNLSSAGEKRAKKKKKSEKSRSMQMTLPERPQQRRENSTEEVTGSSDKMGKTKKSGARRRGS